MKKIIAVFMAVSVMFTLAACSKEPELENDVQVKNPIVSVESAKEFESLDISLDALEGATEQSYSIINNEIAQIKFLFDEKQLTLRGSKIKSGDEQHGMYVDFKDEKTVIDADGDNYSYSVEVMMIDQSDGAVAISTINSNDNDILHLSLSTTSKIDSESMLSIMQEICEEVVNN